MKKALRERFIKDLLSARIGEHRFERSTDGLEAGEEQRRLGGDGRRGDIRADVLGAGIEGGAAQGHRGPHIAGGVWIAVSEGLRGGAQDFGRPLTGFERNMGGLTHGRGDRGGARGLLLIAGLGQAVRGGHRVVGVGVEIDELPKSSARLGRRGLRGIELPALVRSAGAGLGKAGDHLDEGGGKSAGKSRGGTATGRGVLRAETVEEVCGGKREKTHAIFPRICFAITISCMLDVPS